MRARNLKPSIFKNELLATSDPLYTIVFEGLWCMADREGRLEDRPRRIHLEINPGRAYEGTERALSWLDEHGFVVRYEHGAGQFIQVVNFLKHQNPHIREPKSVIPEPEASTVPAPGFDPNGNEQKHGASTVPEADASEGEHGARQVPAQGEHESGPALSSFPLPDSPFPLPDSGEVEPSPQGSSARAPASGAARAGPMPADWQPNETNRRWLAESGMSEQQQSEVIGEFVRWAQQSERRKSERNWQLTFSRNPTVKAAVGRAKALNGPASTGNGAPKKTWREQEAEAKARGEDIYALPGEPGYCGPAMDEHERILRERKARGHG